MSQSNFKTLPQLRVTLAQLGPWQGLVARNDYRIYPYILGARVAADSEGDTLTLHGQGDFQNEDFVMLCAKVDYGGGFLFVPNTAKIGKIEAGTGVSGSDDAVTLDSAMAGVTAGDWLMNLGDDQASNPLVTPNYDGMGQGSRLLMFDSPVSDGDNPEINTDNFFNTGQMGMAIGWLASGVKVVNLLVTDQLEVPQVMVPTWTLGTEVAN
jgi:hypothetical protein